MERFLNVLIVVLAIVLAFSIKSCQCNLRAGNGITSHYNPFIGCVFEQTETQE